MNAPAIIHDFYDAEDTRLAAMLPHLRFLDEALCESDLSVEKAVIHRPDEQFGFLHETAIIEYHGVLYASWYNCPETELSGYTPICGKRSFDRGITWSDLEILCDDKSETVLYCPPVYGICDDQLYMLVNQMVSPDHMHALDLYRLNNETAQFELLWSRPIPFKLNTNVVTLPNGKLMLPGRIAATLDGFPNTPAVLIADDGRIDTEWRLVKIAENGDLPDGKKLVHPELTVMQTEDTLFMFCRNDERHVPLAYASHDNGESWSTLCAHDVPYVGSKMYAGTLSDGRKYLVANIDTYDRARLAVYFTETGSRHFTKRQILFDSKQYPLEGAVACHYPAACEFDNKLYIIATLNYEWLRRGAVVFTLDLKDV
ncbi:MAG: hypothetical protein E7549_01500 [Ruminococcaceae bacterium]|nr:hypothetical protein [Oscillospiraceae bacterium]